MTGEGDLFQTVSGHKVLPLQAHLPRYITTALSGGHSVDTVSQI